MQGPCQARDSTSIRHLSYQRPLLSPWSYTGLNPLLNNFVTFT